MSSQDHYGNAVGPYSEDNSTADVLGKALKVDAAPDSDVRNVGRELTVLKTYIDNEKENSGVRDHNLSTVPSFKRKRTNNIEDTSGKHKPNEDILTSIGYANIVASHYNRIAEKGFQERSKSRIVYLRNFHYWIKSMLINEFLSKLRSVKKQNAPLKVLDIACGKGGDLLKWKEGNITHLICSDIASVSLQQCKNRYIDMKEQSARDKNGGNVYSIEYIHADCSRSRLREKFSDPSLNVDIVNCQFALHYSFESLSQAECMLRNAGECLQEGGYFIGTIPDSNDLVARAKRANSNVFGNDVYKVVFDCDVNKPPLFGAKYNFYLDGVVDCPEFLVHFPTLVKLAKKFGLKLVQKEKFYDIFNRMKRESNKLLTDMNSFEAYPPFNLSNLNGTAEDDYKHAEIFLRENGQCHRDRDLMRVGTLSKSEWEASSLYLAFAFEKEKNT